MAALLGIVANTMFLEEFGSRWLPVTYLFIAGAGIIVSGLVARSARSGELIRVAATVLAGSVVALLAAWWVAAGGDGSWVSGPLLVLFPVLIQLGFVFIGGQGGRVLDLAGIKAYFPRIFAGFPVGAIVGGLIAGPLLTVVGRPEHLLFAVAVAQAAFLCLVLLSGRLYASELAPIAVSRPVDDPRRQPLTKLLRHRFVLLIVAYQVLSAVGSQLADFLVFDRAAARYADGEELARFVARYTAVMNIASILFLVLLAGALLRRFGLKVGLPANPAVLAAIAFGMIFVAAVVGIGSSAFLIAVSAARIADIALTDGTTRTSINATYQVLPDDEQLAVQASVEGIGVPVAIGVSGVIILVLDALPYAVETMILATTITCVVWTLVAVWLYREYGSALVRALRRRPVLDAEWTIDHDDPDEAAATALLTSGDERVVQLGLDLLAAMASPALGADLERLADDPRPEIRLAALARLAVAGDADSRERLRADARANAASADPEARVRAAQAMGALDADDRAASAELFADREPTVRTAAIEAVRRGDVHAIEPVLAALADPSTSLAAAGAIERLGDSIAPSVARTLDGVSCPAPPSAARLVSSARLAAPALAHEMFGHLVRHRDREFGLAVLQALATPDPAPPVLVEELDLALREDASLAAKVVQATAACAELAPVGSPLHRALADQLDLLRSRIVANCVARHGSERLGPAVLALRDDRRRRGLALEALELTMSHDEAALTLPVLKLDAVRDGHLAQLPVSDAAPPGNAQAWLADMIDDTHDEWRSPWLRACALHTAMGAAVLVTFDVERLRARVEPLVDELLAS